MALSSEPLGAPGHETTKKLTHPDSTVYSHKQFFYEYENILNQTRKTEGVI